MKIGTELRCKSCGASFTINKEDEIVICAHCQSVFEIIRHKEDLTPSEKLFEIIEDVSFKKSAKNIFDQSCFFIDANYTVEDYMRDISEITERDITRLRNLATMEYHTDLFKKMVEKVEDTLEENEKALLYKDKAAFKLGITGFLLTDKRLLFISKKQIDNLLLKNIVSISSSYSNFYLNHHRYRTRAALDSVCLHHYEMALILGLVCTLAKNSNEPDYKIKVSGDMN